jgi:hypothetical protein
MNTQDAQAIPPWVRYFLVHVVKRCLKIAIVWIEEIQAACK